MGLKSLVGALCIIALVFVYLTGCSSSSSSGGSSGNVNKDVQYSINGLEISSNADGVVENAKKDGVLKHLYWGCGNYKGQRSRFVSLYFKKTNSTWDFQTDVISHGNCR